MTSREGGMGQAFRRAAGRIKPSTGVDSTAVSPKMESVVDRKPPLRPNERGEMLKARESDILDSDGASRSSSENVLEERDRQYDAMLSQMVGRIRSRPGGKLEMGEASVVERYDRPMPKLRNTNIESSKYEDRPAPPGTLNVAQMRHVMLLHEGKADDHDGPMGVQKIAEKYNVSITQIQTILQFLSLPPEDSSKEKKDPK